MRHHLNFLKIRKKRHFLQKRNFWTKKRALSRIGPHNEIILSILIGGMLGDLHAKKQHNATRFQFCLASKNQDYVFWLYDLFYKNGYCSEKPPRLTKHFSKKTGSLTYSYRFNSFSFTSLNWIYEIFYRDGIKRIPPEIQPFFNSRALAILFMNDGYRCKEGACIATLCFSFHDVVLLKKIIEENFKLFVTTQRVLDKHGKVSWRLYIPKNQMPLFVSLIKPYLLKSMSYKLGNYVVNL